MAKTESTYDLSETEKRDLIKQAARIPTGFRLKAQGCEARATLGERRPEFRQPQRGCGWIIREGATTP